MVYNSPLQNQDLAYSSSSMPIDKPRDMLQTSSRSNFNILFQGIYNPQQCAQNYMHHSFFVVIFSTQID
jgi:hypothetical protein